MGSLTAVVITVLLVLYHQGEFFTGRTVDKIKMSNIIDSGLRTQDSGLRTQDELCPDSDIDFVIPWVDGSDTKWLQQKVAYHHDELSASALNTAKCYRDWGLLPYWFRTTENMLRGSDAFTSSHADKFPNGSTLIIPNCILSGMKTISHANGFLLSALTR